MNSYAKTFSEFVDKKVTIIINHFFKSTNHVDRLSVCLCILLRAISLFWKIIGSTYIFVIQTDT